MKWATFTASTCVVIAACTATTPVLDESTKPPESHTLMQLAQRGYQQQARFELCRSATCPRLTSKTLGSALQSTTLQARPAASSPDHRPTAAQEFLEGEERIDADVVAAPIRPVGPLPETQMQELFPGNESAPELAALLDEKSAPDPPASVVPPPGSAASTPP